MIDTEALDRESYINLITFKRNGDGVETPVWHVVIDGRVYIFTEADAYKVKRLRRDDRTRLAACNWSGKVVHGEWIDGHGKVVEDEALEARVYEALEEKYGWLMTLANWMSWLFGRIDNRAVLEITV